MRRIICTTGTSIAAGVKPLVAPEDLPAYAQAIRDRLEHLADECPDQDAFLTRASAETNSILHFGPDPEDEVHLLHTETPDGDACAQAVGRLVETKLGLAVRLHRVAGLQVNDAVRFRREGIQKLFAALDGLCLELQDRADDQAVLNATGGFKSVVPYLTLYGLLNRLPVIYIFERSNALLTLPPAPVQFDYERLSRAIEALSLLQQKHVMPADEFFRAIPGLPHHERLWYDALIEHDRQGYVTLSAFGMMLAAARERQQSQVLLSLRARDQLAASGGSVREQFLLMLDRVKDPLWRAAKKHPFANTDLTVFKPGRTGERMACILRSPRVYVCELLRHDEYERVLPMRHAAQYDLGGFVPWTAPPDMPRAPATEEEAWQRLQTQLQETDACWRAAEQRLGGTEQSLGDARQRLGETQQRLSDIEQRLVEAQAEARRQASVAADAQEQALRVDPLEAHTRQLQEELAAGRARIAAMEADATDARSHAQLIEELKSRLKQAEDELTELRGRLSWDRLPWWRKLIERRPPRRPR